MCWVILFVSKGHMLFTCPTSPGCAIFSNLMYFFHLASQAAVCCVILFSSKGHMLFECPSAKTECRQNGSPSARYP